MCDSLAKARQKCHDGKEIKCLLAGRHQDFVKARFNYEVCCYAEDGTKPRPNAPRPPDLISANPEINIEPGAN
jgi:hypothetical protein